MISVVLKENESFDDSQSTIKVIENKKYIIKTEVSGFYGKPYSAYFGVILYENEKQIGRRIKWLNDFSGNKKKYEIIFITPTKCNSLRFIYRINKETPLQSKCSYEILPINKITLEENSDLKENYDLPTKYHLPRLKELSFEEENLLEKNLVWIFASRRSGTTWLGRDLLSYKTKFMNEPLIGKVFDFTRESTKDPIKRYIDVHRSDASYFFSDHYKETWKFYLRKLILNRIYSQFQDVTSKIIIKEPNGSMGSDVILECLPNSKIIVLLRDGRDVMDSNLYARQEGSWQVLQQNLKPILKNERLSFIKEKAEEWINLIQVLLRSYNSHSQELKMLIRYEDLRGNTLELLQKIYKFIEIDVDNEQLKEIVNKYKFENLPNSQKGEGKFIRSATPGKWKESFNDDEKKILEEIMNNTLKKLGYN